MIANADKLVLRREEWLQTILQPASSLSIDLVGTPGYYRVPRDWNSRKEGLEEHLFHFVIDGSFQALIGRRTLRVLPHALLWVPPRTPFRFHDPKPGETIIFRFRLRLEKEGRPCCLKRPLYFLSRISECRLWFEQILREIARLDGGRSVRVRGLALCLFTEIFEGECYERAKAGRLTHEQQRLLSIRLQERVGEALSPGDLAKLLAYSDDYFSRIFKSTYGVSCRRWIVEERIRLAGLRLLESDRTATEIAAEFGYSDLFFFSRQFKQVTGWSPTEFRRQNGGIKEEAGAG